MNETDTKRTDSFCLDLHYFYQLYWKIAFASLSILLNFACVLIFVKIIRAQKMNDDLFKYLVTKSIVDTTLTLLLATNTLLTQYPDTFGFKHNKSLHFFHLIFNIYVLFSLQLLSMFCEVAACFNRYRMSIGKLKLFDKIPFKLVISSMSIYSFGFYIYKFVSNQIKEQSNNSTVLTYYYISITDLDETMGYMHSFVRDCLCVSIITLLNVLTMIEIKRMISKKRFLTKCTKTEQVKKTETRLSVMIFTMSTLAIIGHGSSLIFYLSPNVSFFRIGGCYFTLSESLNLLSYQINFIFYYQFNLNFQRIVNECFMQLLVMCKIKAKSSAMSELTRVPRTTSIENSKF